MLVAAAVCPHPPLLVPGVAAGATGELDGLRTACDEAVARLLEAEHDLLVVVGAAPAVGPFPSGAWGSLRAYGGKVDVPAGDGEPTLPLSLTIGQWLLGRSAAVGAAEPLLFGVAPDAEPQRCLVLGETLAGRARRVAMLVMGDSSGRRTPKPGYLDERAEPFDDLVAAALRDGNPEALAAVDADLADELLAAGRPAWQVLAGAASGREWEGAVTYAAAPYGVAYLVATWTPEGAGAGTE